MITLGYCCNSLGTHKTNFKNMTYKKYLAMAKAMRASGELGGCNPGNPGDQVAHLNSLEKHLFKIYHHNIKELIAVLKYNIANDIKLYRISSSLFPFWSMETVHWIDEDSNKNLIWPQESRKGYTIWPAGLFGCLVKNKLTSALDSDDFTLFDTVKEYLDGGGRLTMHPGEFISLGTSNVRIQRNSHRELFAHSAFLDWIKAPKDYSCPINIHVSSGAQNIRIVANQVNLCLRELAKHHSSTFDRLVLEIEDKGQWTWQNLIKHFPGMPITFDVHHWKINNQGESLVDALDACSKTWLEERKYNYEIDLALKEDWQFNRTNPRSRYYQECIKDAFTPLMHISEGRDHEHDRSHHDYVETIPEMMLDSPFDISLEVEAKAKDLAYFALRNKYKELVA